jgi:hypothetical protein
MSIVWDCDPEFFCIRKAKRAERGIVWDDRNGKIVRPAPGCRRYELAAFHFDEEPGRPAYAGWEIYSPNLLCPAAAGVSDNFDAAKRDCVAALAELLAHIKASTSAQPPEAEE